MPVLCSRTDDEGSHVYTPCQDVVWPSQGLPQAHQPLRAEYVRLRASTLAVSPSSPSTRLSMGALVQLFNTGAAFISAGDGLTILKLLNDGAVTVSFPNEVAVRHQRVSKHSGREQNT